MITQNSTGALEATAVSPVGWTTAYGALTGNGTTLELSFGTAPMTALVSPTCWTLRFANMQQWQRGEAFDNIVRGQKRKTGGGHLTAIAPCLQTTVHLIYMVHLDIGFTDLARGVCELYFDKHYPPAIALAEALAARGGPEQYAWTSHPWMIQEYLDGVAGCATTPRTPAQAGAGRRSEPAT